MGLLGLPWQNTADQEAHTTEMHVRIVLGPGGQGPGVSRVGFLLSLSGLAGHFSCVFPWSSLCA